MFKSMLCCAVLFRSIHYKGPIRNNVQESGKTAENWYAVKMLKFHCSTMSLMVTSWSPLDHWYVAIWSIVGRQYVAIQSLVGCQLVNCTSIIDLESVQDLFKLRQQQVIN